MTGTEETPYEVRSDETTAAERRAAWEIGAGLQRVDGLEPSRFAYEVMEDRIAGRSTYEQVENAVRQHYETLADVSPRQVEADHAALRIAQIINEPGFTLSPGSLAAIHGRIFAGLLDHAQWEGRFRTEDIRKSEPVLGGESVAYTPHLEVPRTLQWEFDQERDRALPQSDSLKTIAHVIRFLSTIWQVHPFREGNTRAITTYGIKYLRDLAVPVNNEPFRDSSPYFRDALVLDNAPRRRRDPGPLRQFIRHLAGERVELPDLRSIYPTEGTSR